jgi:WD40 repeat protein
LLFARHVLAVAIAPSLAFVVSASFDTTVRIWRLETGTSAGQLNGHTDRVTSVAVSADSSLIVSGSADSTVRVWDATSRKPITIVTHHDKDMAVWAVAVAPDDTYIASCSSDRTVRITSMHEWKLVATLRGHTSFVAAVAIAADGSFVASAGNDGGVRIWSMPSTGLRKIYSGRQFLRFGPPTPPPSPALVCRLSFLVLHSSFHNDVVQDSKYNCIVAVCLADASLGIVFSDSGPRVRPRTPCRCCQMRLVCWCEIELADRPPFAAPT